VEVSHIAFQLKGLMGYMEKFIYGLMQISFSYGSIWLKIGTAQQVSMEVSNVKFKKCMK
jgi:hypothetical protein